MCVHSCKGLCNALTFAEHREKRRSQNTGNLRTV